MAWIDCLKKGKHFGRSILIVGEHALASEIRKTPKGGPLVHPRKAELTMPFNLPSIVLNQLS